MTRAYDEIYLDDAMKNLGSAFEYATIICKIDGREFMDLFVLSDIAAEFEKGNAKYVSGMSGIELSRLIIKNCGKKLPEKTDIPYVDYPLEYWTGWIMAYYQWYANKPFFAIFKKQTTIC